MEFSKKFFKKEISSSGFYLNGSRFTKGSFFGEMFFQNFPFGYTLSVSVLNQKSTEIVKTTIQRNESFGDSFKLGILTFDEEGEESYANLTSVSLPKDTYFESSKIPFFFMFFSSIFAAYSFPPTVGLFLFDSSNSDYDISINNFFSSFSNSYYLKVKLNCFDVSACTSEAKISFSILNLSQTICPNKVSPVLRDFCPNYDLLSGDFIAFIIIISVLILFCVCCCIIICLGFILCISAILLKKVAKKNEEKTKKDLEKEVEMLKKTLSQKGTSSSQNSKKNEDGIDKMEILEKEEADANMAKLKINTDMWKIKFEDIDVKKKIGQVNIYKYIFSKIL